MKSYKDKKLLVSLLALGLFAGLSGHIFEGFGHASIPTPTGLNSASAILAVENNLAPSSLPATPGAVVGFAGEIDLTKDISNSVSKNFNGDYSKLFTNASFLQTPDVTFAEVSDSSGTVAALPAIAAAGVDVVSLDPSTHGTLDTLLADAQSAGIKVCGAGSTKASVSAPIIFSKNGYTVGFLCFNDTAPQSLAATDTQSGLLLASDPNFDTIVKTAKGEVNALVVSFDFGVSSANLYNDRQETLAKEAIDDGAMVVAGTHPHASEATTTYNNAPIFYSLGDFISDHQFTKTSSGTFATVTLSGTAVSTSTVQNISLDSTFSPSLAPTNQAN